VTYRPLRLIPLIFTALVLSACGDSTGPAVLDVRGDWSYSVSGLGGSGFECDVIGVRLQLQQEGTAIAGESTPGTLSCTGDGQLYALDLAAAEITGSATRNSAAFRIGDESWRHSGSLGGGVLTGSVTLVRELGGSPVTLTGSFTARLEI
jgi:hypothetical protein